MIFDENESKSVEEVESLLQKLETKSDKRNEIHKVNQIHKIGMNLSFLHLKMIHPVRLLHQCHLGLLAVHPTLLAAAVLLTMTLRPRNLQFLNKHQFTSTLFSMMVIFHNLKPVNINCQNGCYTVIFHHPYLSPSRTLEGPFCDL